MYLNKQNKMAKLKSYIKYSGDDTVVPMSLVKARAPLKAKGHWLELYSVCCDPRYTPYLAYGNKKAWVQLNHKGEPIAGPIIRKSKPKAGKYIQVPYNICCDFSIVAPAITTQPVDTTVTEGADATFTVVATGTNLTYQWYLDGAAIPGATADSLTIPATTVADSGNTYYVEIANAQGTVTSATVTLTVNPAP